MDELVKRLRSEAIYLPEKFSKNAELLDVLMKAADAIEELRKQVASCSKSVASCSKWIGVEERLPEEHVRVLIINDDGKMMIGERAEDDWWYKYFAYDVDRWDENEQGHVTHWMPLPSTEGLNET